MSAPSLPVSFETTAHVRDHCLCLHTQRAARVVARRFDEALRPHGLTNGQFSLLMSLNRPEPPTIAQVASLLGADRTTLTAALKPLVKSGLAAIATDAEDRRARRVSLTPDGNARLAQALDAWTTTHAAVEAELADVNPDRLRAGLDQLSGHAPGPDQNQKERRP
ncbi:MarR family winged helix-turn-helix transcriptional regulator [Caulobacter mirabilis]|uniref:MarR family transcriptional regulator n=1 Tax=Caulobacter mirabilis TaxID=69666 RepID=A0A2D2B0E1_9CAUL|nr:MarR family transcriptional regulator [Caulobacter mirabilis]ATQ43729.1 MarR family transcriptional regulator [Caulobacter mirabilis]